MDTIKGPLYGDGQHSSGVHGGVVGHARRTVVSRGVCARSSLTVSHGPGVLVGEAGSWWWVEAFQ